ncbi:unnamed protein product, partial [Ixodes hexagonus]
RGPASPSQAGRPREESAKRLRSEDEPRCPRMCLAVVELGLLADAAWSSGNDPFHERARRLWLAYHRHEPPGRYLSQLDALLARDEAQDGAAGEAPSLDDQRALWQNIERVRNLWDAPAACGLQQPHRQPRSATLSRQQRRRLALRGAAAGDAQPPCLEASVPDAGACALGCAVHRPLQGRTQTPALLRRAVDGFVDAQSEHGGSDHDVQDDEGDASPEDSDYETCTENVSAPDSEDCQTPPPQ